MKDSHCNFQTHTAPQPQTAVQAPIQTLVSQGHWEEILFCLEPQGSQPAPQPVMVGHTLRSFSGAIKNNR